MTSTTTAPRTCARLHLESNTCHSSMPTRCAHTPCSFLLRRPKRNIRTAMNHEVMMYAIAQKVCGKAITNHNQLHPDLRSPLSLAARRSSSASTRRSRCIACTSNHDSLVNLATRPDHIPFAIGRSASTVSLRRRQTCLAPLLAPDPSFVLPTTTCMYRHVALRRLVRSLESNTPNHSTS